MKRSLLAGVVFSLATLTFGTHSTALAEKVEAVTVDWAPYYGSELKKGGVIAELARAAFANKGHEMTVEFIPWKRAMEVVKRGQKDVVLGAYYSDERAADFRFSKPFYDIEIGFMAKNSLGISSYDSLKELEGYRIGYQDGWAYTEEFDNADYLTKDPASNQTLSVRKLFRDRVDMVAMARGIFRYEASQLSSANLDEITFIDPPLTIGKLHMMFAKNAENSKKLKADFDAGLKAIRENGTYEKIINEYGF